MNTTDYIKVLQDKKEELEEELALINKLIARSGVSVSSTRSSGQVSTEDIVPIVVEDKSRSAVARVRNALKKLIEHEVSLQIDDIRHNLDRLGVEDYNKSTIHNALKYLKEKNEITAYKINNSNHLVFYMHPDGKSEETSDFPVKPEYRPKSISEADIETFEFIN